MLGGRGGEGGGGGGGGPCMQVGLACTILKVSSLNMADGCQCVAAAIS